MIQAGPFRQRDNVVSHQWDNSPRPTSGHSIDIYSYHGAACQEERERGWWP